MTYCGTEAPTLPIIQPSNELPEEFVSAFHQKVLDSLHDGVYFVDRSRKILYWNKGAEILTGYTAAEVIGRSCFDNILMHVTETGCSLCVNGCPLQRTIQDGKRRESEVYLRHKFGHRVPVSVRVAPIMDRFGNIVGAVETFTDVSAKKHIERRVGELENLVFLDALTSVANRRFIELKVKQAIQEVEQFDRNIGLLMIDLDNFKGVNDEFGHAVGDEVLKSVCSTLHISLRSGDLLGRWGGEELLILISDVTPDRLRTFAERCRMLVAESFIPAGPHPVKVSVSIGATLIRKEDTEQTAVQRADELMYRSKADGKNRVTSD